jgi:hypothetical protein
MAFDASTQTLYSGSTDGCLKAWRLGSADPLTIELLSDVDAGGEARACAVGRRWALGGPSHRPFPHRPLSLASLPACRR